MIGAGIAVLQYTLPLIALPAVWSHHGPAAEANLAASLCLVASLFTAIDAFIFWPLPFRSFLLGVPELAIAGGIVNSILLSSVQDGSVSSSSSSSASSLLGTVWIWAHRMLPYGLAILEAQALITLHSVVRRATSVVISRYDSATVRSLLLAKCIILTVGAVLLWLKAFWIDGSTISASDAALSGSTVTWTVLAAVSGLLLRKHLATQSAVLLFGVAACTYTIISSHSTSSAQLQVTEAVQTVTGPVTKKFTQIIWNALDGIPGLSFLVTFQSLLGPFSSTLMSLPKSWSILSSTLSTRTTVSLIYSGAIISAPRVISSIFLESSEADSSGGEDAFSSSDYDDDSTGIISKAVTSVIALLRRSPPRVLWIMAISQALHNPESDILSGVNGGARWLSIYALLVAVTLEIALSPDSFDIDD
ncbi:hypothetical protein GQ42DRAFT_163012 [Ramicandelaber brevisporus]|nr:hypothetical protein GQ42DRAFT_163012 [Ramicandelaber brevisporus]